MQTLDYFALKPKILFNKNYAHPTTVGTIATISVIVITVLTLSSFSRNFLYKKSPIISSSESNFKEPPIFELNGDQFNMGFYFLYNLNKYVMDPSLFKIKAFMRRIYLKQDNNTVGEELLDLELEQCNEKHFPNDFRIKKSFLSLGIDKSICFKQKQKNLPRLVGIWGQENFETVLIKYQRCVNGTDSE